MQGKNIFTTTEAEEIKKLIASKEKAPADKQKGIRSKIRSLGFYYSDFNPNKDGYTVRDFQALIDSGRIRVLGSNLKSISPLNVSAITSVGKSIATEKSNSVSSNLDETLSLFKANLFDPKKDLDSKIPDSPGTYIICLRSNSSLPNVEIAPTMTGFDGRKVIYTGIAGTSLRKRDFRQHFKGNNAGASTLRKSLGVLFGYQLVPRDSDPSTGKTKFSAQDEKKLTEWMCDNLIMYFLSSSNFNHLEVQLIHQFNPPLNLMGNKNHINSEFRKLLSAMRSGKK